MDIIYVMIMLIYIQKNYESLINIIESHIAYLKTSGYDVCDSSYYFLSQLDETNEFLLKNLND